MDWEQTEEERVAGFPSRIAPKSEYAADWKKRTLTNLYNERPTGLKLRCEKLDKAVAKAYGWNDYTPEMIDTEILQRLLKLNLLRTTNKQPSTTSENCDEHQQQRQENEALPMELQQQVSG